MIVVSWNVNGLRSVLSKGALANMIKELDPDVILLQETKIDSSATADLDLPKEYPFTYFSCANKKGYSGTAVLSKVEGKEISLHDPAGEGRLTAVEFGGHVIISVYVPNSKRDLSRLKERGEWDATLVKTLNKVGKPILIGGDFNVANEEIDLARPKANVGEHGFTDEERASFKYLLAGANLVDTWRERNPNKQEYTWWTHWANARANNVGWRIDYLLASKGLSYRNPQIYGHVMGSDHCPVSVEI